MPFCATMGLVGLLYLHGELRSFRRRAVTVPVRNLLVDTGSVFTWIPTGVLEKAGVRVEKKDQEFYLANGQRVTRNTGYAIIRVGGFETADEVAFGLPGDVPILGAKTLEGFGALVDPRGKCLVAVAHAAVTRTRTPHR